MVVRVGPFQRIVNFHWPDESSGETDFYFVPLPQISQDTSGQYGGPGLLGDTASEQYVYRVSGPNITSLGAPSPYAFCVASGGTAVNSLGPVPNRFFTPTDGAEPGYFYIAPEPVPRLYNFYSIGMQTYEYGPNVGPPDPDYVALTVEYVDFITLRYTDESAGGRVYAPVGFFDLTFSGGDLEDGKYLILAP